MYHHVNERSGQEAPLIADDVYEIIMKVNDLLPSKKRYRMFVFWTKDLILLTMLLTELLSTDVLVTTLWLNVNYS